MNTRKIAFTGLLVYVVVTYLVMFTLKRSAVDEITAEDHYFENIGAISLFVASGLYLYAFRMSSDPKTGYSRIRKISYLVLAALFFFGGGEEISWGQRILGIETPEVIDQVNDKDEINLHNLDLFGAKNSFPFKMYQAFALTYALILPLVARFSKKAKGWLERYLTIVPWFFGVIVVVNLFLWQIVSRLTYLGQPGEIQESNYELTFMCIGIYVAYRLWMMVKKPAAVPAPVVEYHAKQHV